MGVVATKQLQCGRHTGPPDRESFLVWVSAWTEEPPADQNLKEQRTEGRRLGFRSSSVAINALGQAGPSPSLGLVPLL